MTTAKNRIIAPVNATETWSDHFHTRGWNTLRDQLNAGYPILLQPTNKYATWEKVIDYGATIGGSMIKLSWSQRDVFGGVPIKTHLAYSPDNSTWYETLNTQQIYGINFQYVRIKFEFGTKPAGTPMGLLAAITTDPTVISDKVLVSVEDIRVRLDSKIIKDGGTVTANAGDTSGTVVNFATAFVDVRTLTGTPQGRDGANLPFKWAIDFDDVPNPTSFKIFVWDNGGTRATVAFRWAADGI